MSDEQAELEPGASTRRRVLAGAGLAGAAAVLGACGTDPSSNYEVPPPPPPPASGSPPGSPPGEADAADDSSDDEDDPPVEGLASVDQVEVGGGLVLADEDLVITRPAEDVWNGFSAICTHQGCTVAEVVGGTINCNCHGSKFSIEDGSVVTAAFDGDPSQQDPLPAVAIAVDGDQVVRA